TIGTSAPGTSCTADGQCRSGVCQHDPRFGGNPNANKACLDFCGSDAYCASGTSCQVLVSTQQTAQCFNVLATQTIAVDATCTAGTINACRNGGGACLDAAGGACKASSASCKCRKPCCKNADCAA